MNNISYYLIPCIILVSLCILLSSTIFCTLCLMYMAIYLVCVISKGYPTDGYQVHNWLLKQIAKLKEG